MNFASSFLYRLRWIHLPGTLLVALLQRTPVLRVAASAEELLTASPLGAVLRAAFTGIASLGAVHALAGATQFVFSRSAPYTGTVGTTFPTLVFTVTGALTPAGSFRITNVPPGLTVAGLNANGLVNASSAVLSGTPTTAGTFAMTVLAYEFNNALGDFWPTTPEGRAAPITITFTIAAGAAVAPVFTVQPLGQSVNVGDSVTLTSLASGSPAPTYQWRKNGTNVLGATAANFVIASALAADAGDYSVVATSGTDSVTSNTATLRVSVPGAAAGRLSNLSVRTAMAAGQTLIVGVVVDDGPRDILVRAVGPALAAFGLTNAMTDPRLDLFDGTTSELSNDDWPAGLVSTFAAVGAFSLPTNSKDAAFLRQIVGARSIQARGTGAGVVLVEAYDTGAVTAARLVNVSARNRVGTGDEILIAGFNISGSGSRQLLIRAVGPKLSAFGVGGVLADPKLEIYNGTGTKLTENDNWNAALAATFSAVGAFALDNGSRDAALLTDLPPGTYTAQVRGADGGTGEALIEIYEVK